MLPTTNYIFFGSPEFAAIILEKLIDAGYIPEAVVCNPDKPVGRKRVITPPLVKQVVSSKGYDKNRIKILQPETKDDLIKTKPLLLATNPKLLIVAAYAKILPKEILEIPRLGTIGVHPSLLPKFRGPSPIQSFILSDETETGATLFLMDEKVDNGPIISQRKLGIDKNELEQINYKTLEKKLAELSADLLIETLPKFVRNEIKFQPQDESQATYTQKIKTEDAYVNPVDLAEAGNNDKEKALKIWRKIRAFNPEPGVWTLQQVQGKPLRQGLRLSSAECPQDKSFQPAQDKQKRMKILEAVLTPEGKLKLKKIQFEGKNPVFV